ncbi:MAG: hypothetical protein IPP33_09870 [Flavobacteriales bacterium]|nr:hypothetical protein [Flavobacteriales bacterium]
MWYTYLRGRSGPEIDDRDFFPSAKIPADAPQPWSVGERFGKLKLSAEQEATLLKNYTVGFVLFQNDSMIHEQYWNGWNSDSVSNSFSVAKSYVSVLTGIAMQEGKIKSVFQPVGDFLPEFAQEECKKRSRSSRTYHEHWFGLVRKRSRSVQRQCQGILWHQRARLVIEPTLS